jgi:H+/gluconate symporter-like permease
MKRSAATQSIPGGKTVSFLLAHCIALLFSQVCAYFGLDFDRDDITKNFKKSLLHRVSGHIAILLGHVSPAHPE